jgi:hypothetical protein
VWGPDGVVRGTPDQRYAYARRLASIAPNSEWQVALLETAFGTLRFAEAVRLSENLEFDRGWLRDWPYPRQARPQALHLLGGYEAELAAAADIDSILPAEAVRTRLRSLAALGRLDAHAALLERTVATLPPLGKASLLHSAAEELATHGRPAPARYLALRAAAILTASGPLPGEEFRHAIKVGRINRTAGHFDTSRHAFESILPDPTAPRCSLVVKELALTAAAAGDRVEALRLLAAFEEERNPRSFGWHSLQMAGVYAALGDGEEAVRLIQRNREEGAG